MYWFLRGLQYAEGVFHRSIVIPMLVRLSIRHASGLCKNKAMYMNNNQPAEGFSFQLGHSVRSPLSDAVFDDKFQGKIPTPERTRYAECALDHSTRTVPTSRKTLTHQTTSFPIRPIPKTVLKVIKANSKFAFFAQNSIRTSEVCYRFSIAAKFLQHNFRAIITSSYCETKSAWLVDSPKNTASFPY